MTRISQDSFSFDSAATRTTLSVVSFQGTEILSRPFRFDVDVAPADPDVDLDPLIGQPASLTVRRPGSDAAVHGVVTEIEEGLRRADGLDVCRVTLEPRWSLLDLRGATRGLQGVTVPEAVLAVVAGHGGVLGPDDVEMRLSREHPRHDQLVQERESSLSFLTRALEREGIVCFFEHRDGRERLVLADDAALLPAIEGSRLPYGEAAEPGAAFVRSLVRLGRIAPGDGAPGGAGGLRTFRGGSTSPALRAGHRFSVSGHPRRDFDRDLVLTAVRHRGDAAHGYRNEFVAIATDDLLRRTRETSSRLSPERPAHPSREEPAHPSSDTAAASPSIWRVGRARSDVAPAAPTGARRPLAEQQHLTVDDDQNARLDAVEQKNTQQDAKDTQHDQKIAAIETKNAEQDAKDAQQDQKLQSLTSDTQNTWLRFNVPYGTDKTSYLRLGKAPGDAGDIEPPLQSKLSLNAGSLDGHFEYTTGNRTVITGGNKEEIVDGKHRIAINSGGLGLFDADPIYFLDFSQDVTGAWRKSEFTHVSTSQFAMGDTSSWMMGVTGGYFLGIKVDVFASLSMTVGLGINYNHVKGISFQEAKLHDVKARERITIRVKEQDPFFTGKTIGLAAVGIVAAGVAAGALAGAKDRTSMGQATAAAGTAPTVGLATAASVAALLDIWKRYKRKTAGDRADNDSVITLTPQHVDIKSGANNTSLLVDGAHDVIMMSADNGSSFVCVAGPGGAGGDMVYLTSTGAVRLAAPQILLAGDVNIHGNVHMFNDLQVDGNLNGAPFVAAAAAPPPPALVLPAVPAPAPAPVGFFQGIVNRLRFW